MAGPVNIWAAGQDALLQQLAQRDAEEQRQAELARRAQLDEEARLDRERMRELQEKQYNALENERLKDREFRDTQAKAVASEKADKAAQDRLRRDAIHEFRTTTDPNRKKEMQQLLELEYEMRFEKPEKETLHAYAPGTSVYDSKGNFKFKVPDRPEKGPAPDKPFKDDPTFPRGAKDWVDNVIAMGKDMDETVGAITRGWGQQRSAHPNADLGKAIDYVKKFYSSQGDPWVGGAASEPPPPPPPKGGGPGSAAAPGPAAAPSSTGPQVVMQNGKLVVVPPKPAPPPTPRGPDLPIEGPGFGLASKKPASLPPGISMGQFDLPINTPLGATMPGATGAAPPPSQKIPAEVTAVLATVGPGKHTLTDGSVWLKLPDGSIQQVN